VGDQHDDSAARLGTPPHRIVSLINLDLLYGISNRLSVDLTIPFVVGSAAVAAGGTEQAPLIAKTNAQGLGDVTLQAEYWLTDPGIPSRVTGSVGVGFKAPTGDDAVQTTQPGSDGPTPIDESAQLGTGGWEIILRAQGTAQIQGPLYAYASGYYGLTVEEHTDVVNIGDSLRAVPDTYSGRVGAAYLLPWSQGLVFSLGGRINGVTVKDLVGGGDPYWRRPGYAVYVEPGLTWTLGANMASLSVPVRAYANKLDSPYDVSQGRHIGASFASYLLLASYARRF
jgi:hypothetical protein